jgi:NDP-sugar pyrophosphorylase family protein
MFSVVILAGGLATRLRPLTEKIPKAMVLINGKPFIDYQLHYLRKQGIEHVVLCLGYLGNLIETHVGNGSKYGLKVEYSYDGEQYLGTGGAIVNAINLLGEHFFILYGDTFLPIDFKLIRDEFEKLKPKALMTIYHNKQLGDVSNAHFISKNIIEYNKKNPRKDMAYIDYGLSVVSANIFKNVVAKTNVDLADIFSELSKQHKLFGVEVFKPFYEIGTFQGLNVTTKYFQHQEIKEKVNLLNINKIYKDILKKIIYWMQHNTLFRKILKSKFKFARYVIEHDSTGITKKIAMKILQSQPGLRTVIHSVMKSSSFGFENGLSHYFHRNKMRRNYLKLIKKSKFKQSSLSINELNVYNAFIWRKKN